MIAIVWRIDVAVIHDRKEVSQRAIEFMKDNPKATIADIAKALSVGISIIQRLDRDKMIPRVYRMTNAERVARQKAQAVGWHKTRYQVVEK